MSDTPATLKIKQRDLPLGVARGRTDTYQRNLAGVKEWVSGPTLDTPVTGRQVTASEGHPWKAGFSQFEGGDIGGPFETTKRYLASDPYGENPLDLDDIKGYDLVAGNDYGGYVFHGHQLPVSLTDRAWPDPEPSSDFELMAHGTTAISRVKPTNSIADLSVSIAELFREGLPLSPGRSQWKERANVARGAGSEYLNAQFGWLPLISDIQNVSEAIAKGDKIWKQYQRDAGRLVRRRYEFPILTSNATVIERKIAQAYAVPVLVSRFYPWWSWSGGDYTRTRHKRQVRKFSGAFTYYIPKRNESSAVDMFFYHAAQARKLYGLTLDPEVLWNLTPWSWATDWFANTGDLISNLTDFATDGLLMPYGYMMEETIVSDEHKLENLQWACDPPGPSSLKIFCVTKTKKRIRASPYGFGLTFEDFTPRQIAILAALGITR